MLNLFSMSYNASANSIGENENDILASMNFNADNFSHYSFTITYNSKEAVTSNVVAADYAEFVSQVIDQVINEESEEE